jgi:imidazolonepropionase-like amidohydrolase
LIDCHVHLALDGVDFKEALARREAPDLLHNHLKQAAVDYLACGVLMVRDGGDKPCIGLKAGKGTGSVSNDLDIKATGYALRKDGYYGSFLGPGLRNVNEGLAQVRELASLGVDQIKIIVSGIVSFQEYGKVGPVQFSQAELESLVNEAHSLGLKVMAHASSDVAVRLSALAGVDSVEHGYFLSERSLQLLAKKDIAWVPTVVPVAIWTEEPWRNSRSPAERAVLEKTYRLHLKRIREAELMGIRLGIGTDAGAVAVNHGHSYYKELEYFREAGLSPLACLKAGTIQAASIVGADELGSIAPGKAARLIGVRGNPLDDLSVLKQPVCIVLPE